MKSRHNYSKGFCNPKGCRCVASKKILCEHTVTAASEWRGQETCKPPCNCTNLFHLAHSQRGHHIHGKRNRLWTNKHATCLHCEKALFNRIAAETTQSTTSTHGVHSAGIS